MLTKFFLLGSVGDICWAAEDHRKDLHINTYPLFEITCDAAVSGDAIPMSRDAALVAREWP